MAVHYERTGAAAVRGAFAGLFLFLAACGDSPGTANSTATGTPTLWFTETPTPSGTETPFAEGKTPTPIPSLPTPPIPSGSLSVEPTAGSVGTVVTIIGSDFPGSFPLSFFCNAPPPVSGEVGEVLGWAPVELFVGPDFVVTWTIPAELQPRQGEGGGPTGPGNCFFTTSPPYAFAFFEITP